MTTSLIHAFIRSLDAGPERAALDLGDQQLTYAALWDRAGRIGDCLNRSLTRDDSLVGILSGRSVTAYSAVLGVLASGRGYVPLNPKFPLQRTLSMLAASGCRVVVVGAECVATMADLLPRIERPLLILYPETEPVVEYGYPPQHRILYADGMQEVQDPAVLHIDGRSVAYLLFTSGSTGTPKAVAITHDNAAAYLTYAAARYQLRSDDRCSQNFDLTFDLSVHDLFMSWNAGASLCPFTDQYLVPATLIDEKQLTVWFSVPSVATFASRLGLLEPAAFPSLRLSLFCGEPLSAKMARAWQQAASNSVVENLYGPTEATIAITHYTWDSQRSEDDCYNGIVPLGWPFHGHDARIVDDTLSVVADGETGELCLSGRQVAEGYFNDRLRTSRQFVRLPESDATWYLTGDLVSRDEQGCLHYMGRKDQQVKINGYRVELQEIEHVVKDAANTELAVAVPWPQSEGTASGVVAVISGSEESCDGSILERCRERLPAYMVPSHIYHVDQLPITPNGKIDRKRAALFVAQIAGPNNGIDSGFSRHGSSAH
jgi:amino acid adenylation domain-containing protein